MKETFNYETLKLFPKGLYWTIEYQGDDSLVYEDFNDAIISLGILARELTKIMKFPLRVLIFNENQQVFRDSFIFPSFYETHKNKEFKASLLEDFH